MNNTVIERGHVVDIPISQLVPDPEQPRKTFDADRLEELAASLKTGVQVPLLVRPGSRKGKFIIHDGERRYRAAALAKLKTLPVLLVDEGNDQDVRTAQLAVNNMREQLRPIEVARVLADMRKNNFATLNDLAAYLDKNGLPAMTKHQISDMIALVDLPGWAQDMVDAGQVELSAIRKLKIALPYENMLDEVNDALKSQLNWKGRIVANDIVGSLRSGFWRNGKDLSETQTWQPDPVHFEAETACKGCEHLVKFDGGLYCMDLDRFKKKNDEAKAAGLGPGGSKPEKSINPEKVAEPDQEEKAKARVRTLNEKARDYLHSYLIGRVVDFLLNWDADARPDIARQLLTWYAMDCPGTYGNWGPKPGLDKYLAAEETSMASLEDISLLTTYDHLMIHAAAQIASQLQWRETQVICHQLWGDAIADVWKMDELFVKLFRKAELLHLVEQHDLGNEYGGVDGWGKLKVSEIKAALLERADQVRSPAILADIYKDVAEPYKPYNWRGDDDEK